MSWSGASVADLLDVRLVPTVAAAVAAGVLSCLAQPALISLLRRHAVLDTPNHRSSHSTAMPRGGGMAVMAGVMAGLAVASWQGLDVPSAFWLGLIGFALLGLVEDVRGASVEARLLGQLATGYVTALLVLRHTSGGIAVAWVLGVFAAAVLLVACTNAFNFMDGVNGMSALNALVAAGAYGLIASQLEAPAVVALAAATGAAAAGFLPWNVPRARVFLGDVGSYGLGAALGLLCLSCLVVGAPPELCVAPLSFYAADTAWTLFRRIRRGERWYEAHREFVYQRLADAGLGHLGAAAVAAFGATAVILLAQQAVSLPLAWRLAADAGLLALPVLYVALPALRWRDAQASPNGAPEPNPGIASATALRPGQRDGDAA